MSRWAGRDFGLTAQDMADIAADEAAENAELRQKLAVAERRYKEAELRLAALQERIHAALAEACK